MNGILFDRSLGFQLPNHFYATTMIPVFTRADIVKELKRNPQFPVSDRKFVEFASKHKLLLVTGDVHQMFDARDHNVPCICIYPQKPLWEKILRILSKTSDPFFRLFELKVIDLRDLWHDTPAWNFPRTLNSVRRDKLHTDQTFENVGAEK